MTTDTVWLHAHTYLRCRASQWRVVDFAARTRRAATRREADEAGRAVRWAETASGQMEMGL